jgi:XTP/dITP diphosphohydrolase
MTAQAWELVRGNPVFAGGDSATVTAIRASGIAVTLLPGAPTEQAAVLHREAGGGAVWVAGDDGDAEFARALGQLVLREQGQEPSQLELVHGSWDPPGARLLDVVEVMDRLRSPGGCPWDAEQTHDSLLPYLLEEAYEAYDAVQSGNRADIIEEFGDVLLQAVFHARLGEDAPEGERWNIDDVAGELVTKLVTRHPHVFGDVSVDGSEEVLTNWEEIKRSEKGRSSALDGVARSQPALSLARKYVGKVEKFGLDVPAPSLPEGVEVPSDTEELGDLLLAIVARARALKLDPEAALRDAADRYAGRVRAAETAAAATA